VRIVGRQKLEEFTAKHADARPWIENWIADTELSEWKAPEDIKGKYASASFLSDNVVIFNVKGNRYRLQVLVAYGTGTVVVQEIETHAEYSKPRRRNK
jgi:mRNA interferase HigB